MVLEIFLSFLTAPAFAKTEDAKFFDCLTALEHIERRAGLRAEALPPYAVLDRKTEDIAAVVFPLDDFRAVVSGPDGLRVASLQVDQIENETISVEKPAGQREQERLVPQRRRLVLPNGDEVFLDMPYDKTTARLLGSRMTVKSALLEKPQELQGEIDRLKKKLDLHKEILRQHREAHEAKCAEGPSFTSVLGGLLGAMMPKPMNTRTATREREEDAVPIEIRMDYESIRNVTAEIEALEKARREEPLIRARIAGRVPVLKPEAASEEQRRLVSQFILKKIQNLSELSSRIAPPGRDLWFGYAKKSCGELKWQELDRAKLNQALEKKSSI
ncbi:MAG: hypothetical protein KF802_10215 [Bdellovibrionaceae bacterium]|nr:hypothetical protein [Pseudobdellovibrionaceae bacterium]